ncbi:MAG: biotin--[acetyl-CoA-carboxylase] ligase [Microbacterium sp.]|nr:MAG: biotin--[acetyl-CoA-carboxylase] ligase [Microbacterium sp.]
MPIAPEGYPLAAAVSPRLQVAETVDSTNAVLLRDAADDPDSHPHLSVLLTRDQRAGRGRLDRAWIAPPGTALAISVLLRVGAIEVADRGWIPLVAGAAMARAVAAQLPDARVSLKWPNDVLVARGVAGASAGGGGGDAAGAIDAASAGAIEGAAAIPAAGGAHGRKISGILAEVMPSDPMAVVVGAGVNTAMEAVDLPVPTATSFADQGVAVDEDRLVADYLTGLRDGIAALAVGGGAAVAGDITVLCSTLGEVVAVSLPDGTSLTGHAVGLDDAGRLVVETPGVAGPTQAVVGAGDVVHVR